MLQKTEDADFDTKLADGMPFSRCVVDDVLDASFCISATKALETLPQ